MARAVVAAACTVALGIAIAPAAFAGSGGAAVGRVAGDNAITGNVYPDPECHRLVEYYHSQGRGARCEWHPPLPYGYSELHIGGTGW